MSSKKFFILPLVILLVIPIAVFYWPIGSYTYSNDYFSFEVPNDFIVEQDFVRYTAPSETGNDITVTAGYGVYVLSFRHKIFHEQVRVSLLSMQDMVGTFDGWDTEGFKEQYLDYPGKVVIRDLTVSSLYPSVMAKRVYGHENSLYDLRFSHNPYKTSFSADWSLLFYADWYLEKRVDSFFETFATSFTENR